MSNKPGTYYVPAQSSWPIIGAFALFLVAVGAGMTVQGTQSDGAVGVVGRIVLVRRLFVSALHVGRVV